MAGSVDPGALARDMDQFQVVDVRYPNEWEAGHISGAAHIPFDQRGGHNGNDNDSDPRWRVADGDLPSDGGQ